MIYTTHTEEQTKQVAADFAKLLKGGDVIFLSGDLGSGKTTFVRGVAEAFGFLKPVRSPSFTIVNRYPVAQGAIKQILHVDFYRLNDPVEFLPLALDEEIGRSDTVAFIEWPEKIFLESITPMYQIMCHAGEIYTFTITPILQSHE